MRAARDKVDITALDADEHTDKDWIRYDTYHVMPSYLPVNFDKQHRLFLTTSTNSTLAPDTLG